MVDKTPNMLLILLDCRQPLCDNRFLSTTGLRFVESQTTETFEVSTASGPFGALGVGENNRTSGTRLFNSGTPRTTWCGYSTETTKMMAMLYVDNCWCNQTYQNYWYQEREIACFPELEGQHVVIQSRSSRWWSVATLTLSGSDPTGAGAFASLVWNAAFESNPCLCCWAEIELFQGSSAKEQGAIGPRWCQVLWKLPRRSGGVKFSQGFFIAFPSLGSEIASARWVRMSSKTCAAWWQVRCEELKFGQNSPMANEVSPN